MFMVILFIGYLMYGILEHDIRQNIFEEFDHFLYNPLEDYLNDNLLPIFENNSFVNKSYVSIWIPKSNNSGIYI